MKEYFAYIRVSTTRQGVQGVSLPQQRDAIERYAQRNQLAIKQWFEEQETAAKRGRPVFGAMVKLLRRQAVRGVIIHKIDRSARNLRDWSDLGDLIDRGVEVHFANEALDLSSRGGRLSADIQAVVASDFIRNLREETKKGMYGRLKQGYYPRPAPLGYIDNGGGKPKTLDPATAPLIRQAFELYSSARFSLTSLGPELARLGLRRPDGEPFHRNRLSMLLNNPFYSGLIFIKKTGEYFAGNHEPLVSRALFERVQAIMAGKTNTAVKKHDFVYRRRLACKSCQYSLIGEVQKGHTYYRCHTDCCPTTCLREDIVETAIIREFSRIALNPIERRFLKQELETMRSDYATQLRQRLAALKLRLAQTEERLDRLTDAFIDRLIERDVFEQRKKTLLTERLDLESQQADLRSGKRDISEELAKFLELADRACLTYKQGTVEEKRDLLEAITSNRIIDGKSPMITLRLPFALVADRRNSSCGDPPKAIHRIWGQLLPRLSEELSP